VLVSLSVTATFLYDFEELMEQDCLFPFRDYAGFTSQLTSFYPARTFQTSHVSPQVYNEIQLKKD